MRLAEDMLNLHLPLIQSALGQKVEAKLVGRSHQGRSQRWAVMPNDEVASLPGMAGLHLGWSRSNERTSPFRVKFGLLTSWTGRVIAYAVSDAPSAPVLQAITSCAQHVLLTDEVPRRPVPPGQVSPGYKSYTKGLGHASETGRASPQPRLKGSQQRRSKSECGRLSNRTCAERQNLRVPCGPPGSMRQVSTAFAATKWPDGTSSCQPAEWLRNCPSQPKVHAWRFVHVRRNQHGLVSHC
jgi:hypothetical protein